MRPRVSSAHRGTIADQLARLRVPSGGSLPLRHPNPRGAIPAQQTAAAETAGLEFFNGLGGFDKDGREYVTVLYGARTTPAPRINVNANSCFGFQVSTEGSGYTWAENSRENQLTQWTIR
jgi:cyclic beta-1,2-glucan synthetase